MNDLGTALRELARDATPGAATDPAALWKQGRRRVRRQRILGATVVAAIALAIALAGVLMPQPSVVMPAGALHDPAIPANIYTPSRWLGGTAEDGPIGPLAVLGSAVRRGTTDVFGISATTGVYRFLDLPGRSRQTAVALSPDGRYVAYWLTGRTRGKAYAGVGSDLDPVTGIAYYDTVDGSVRRSPVASEHGLAEDQLFWSDAGTVIASYGMRSSRTGIRGHLTWAWGPGRAKPESIGQVPVSVAIPPIDPDGSYLRMGDAPRRVEVVRRAGSTYAVGRRLVLPVDLTRATKTTQVSFLGLALSGQQLAVVPDTTAAFSAPLFLGRVGPDDTVGSLRRVGEFYDVRLLGWRDPTTLLFQAADPGPAGGHALFEADVRTTSATRLGTLGDEAAWSYPSLTLARDLVGVPMVHGLRPPRPMDPRLRIAVITSGLFLALGVVVLVVRLRRRRAQD
jgi:hypothetical protein